MVNEGTEDESPSGLTKEELEKENQLLRKELEKRDKRKEKSFQRKLWLTKKVGGAFVGKGLVDTAKKFVNELSDKKISKDTFTELLVRVFMRFTRIGLFALIPAVFVGLQVFLLWNQNHKIESQNKLIENQSYLLESQRRSALIFELSAILDKIDEELDIHNEKDSQKALRLSNQLEKRIIALSNSLRPYRYLAISGDLTPRILSPERGQLFVSLLNLKIDRGFLTECEFSYMDLPSIHISGFKLVDGFKARFSNLSGTTFTADTLYAGEFSGSNFEKVAFKSSYFVSGQMIAGDFSEAEFENATFIGTDFQQADFRGADFGKVSFINSDLSGADFRGARFRSMGPFDFTGSNIYGCKFSDSTRTFLLSKGAIEIEKEESHDENL